VSSNKYNYEWDQTLEEVNIHIVPPECVTAKTIECKITTNKMVVGIKGKAPFLVCEFFAQVKANDSFWTFEDKVIHVSSQKMIKGETWNAAFKGHEQLDPISQEKVKRQMMLERFQAENPGFDFSGAEFNGMAPDPKTFMGGIA